MGKGHKIHLWAHIRMFWDNAFYAIKGNLKKKKNKGNLKREKWKRGGRVRSWTESDARSRWASKSGEKWRPVTPQSCSDCGPRYLRPLGSLVKQACKLYSKWLHSKKLWTESALHTTRGGQDYYNKCVRWEFSEYSPPHFPILFKTFFIKLTHTLQGKTKLCY